MIDAGAPLPAVTGAIAGLGTTLTDVFVRPGTGELWVPNTDARNVVRFAPVLDGHLVETRVSIAEPGGGVVSVDLNPHIDRTTTPGSPAEHARSLSQPGAGVFTPDGTTLYLAAFGSAAIGVLDSRGAVIDRIAVGNGPSGVALDPARERLWVLNQLDQTVSVIDTTTRAELTAVGIASPSGFDPTPDVVRAGRRFLYDARATSGHGDVACATCHFAGHTDGLVWDLGDPNGEFIAYADAPWVSFFIPPSTSGFDPMKGPLATQTLRGLRGGGPFHWRGDRPDLLAFDVNFAQLQGAAGPIAADDMVHFAAFLETLHVPPNPYRQLDDQLPPSMTIPGANGTVTTGNPRRGGVVFDSVGAIGNVFRCSGCHAPPTGSNHLVVNEFGSQEIETPDLRHIREKLDFGLGGPQKRGFGVEHDGGRPLPDFLASSRFTLSPQDERDVLAFVLALAGDFEPAVGHQITLDAATRDDAGVRAELDVVLAQASVGACDLIAHGRLAGVRAGWAYDAATGRWQADAERDPVATDALLGMLGIGDVVTITGVPPGAGHRLGIDRDRDTWLDGSETAHGLDPANPRHTPWSTPPACDAPALAGTRINMRDLATDFGRQRLSLRATLVLPADAPFDPLRDGAQVLVEDVGAGGTLVAWSAPGGDADTGCGAGNGWRTSGGGRLVAYGNRSGLLPSGCADGGNGLEKLRFADRRARGGGVEVALKARRARVPTPIGPLRVSIVAGATPRAILRGQCGTASFAPSSCRFGPGRRRFGCR